MDIRQSLYWIGVRESELIGTEGLFSGSITIYGSNNGTNFAFDKVCGYRFDCNDNCEEWFEFVNTTARQLIANDKDCAFMLYYPDDFQFYDHEIKKRTLFINDSSLTSFFENKVSAKLWASQFISLPPYSVVSGVQISLEFLKTRFPLFEEFVVQSDSSCSGSGTWLYSDKTEKDILPRIKQSAIYTISPYIKNSIPLNIHLIIYAHQVVLLPASIQIISITSNSFSYKGADFIAYRHISEQIQKKVERYAELIGNQLGQMGYRGVCGIDFIATEEDAYFMEINSRFQASTMPINIALRDMGIDTSIHKLHMDAFINQTCTLLLPEFQVHYSSYCYTYHENELYKLQYLYSIQGEYSSLITLIDDGMDWAARFFEDAYVFKLLIKRNIVAVSPENTTILAPCIDLESEIIDDGKWQSNLLALKIMLLNNGIRVSESVKQYASANGGLNYKEFEAVDMVLHGLYINAPYNTSLSKISPFEIDLDEDGGYSLNYWGKLLAAVELRFIDELGESILDSGIVFNQIAYLGHDRLRIYHRNGCYYQVQGIGCKFCDIENRKNTFLFSDIKRVIDAYKDHPSVRHYMIGGGSEPPDSDFSNIIKISSYIKESTGKPIYLMSTPPADTGILPVLFNAGITEVTFNLEVFDRKSAVKYMPGKGKLPLALYENALRKAVEIWGNTGNIRTAFIVGLEPKKSLLNGIEFVCSMGVSPILSLLKPIDGTPLAHMLPPSNANVAEICHQAEKICQKYGLPLGPTCKYCEDNILKVSYNIHAI